MDRPPNEESIRPVTINDLNDDILRLVMKKLTMYEQIVNSRLSKRFNRYVTSIEITGHIRKDIKFKYSQCDELDTVAFADALKLVEKFPNLVAIHCGDDFWFDRVDREKLNDFIRKVAMINHKLRYISRAFEVQLLYVMTIKEMVPDYTASLFKHVFRFQDYKMAISKYPDLDLKFGYFAGDVSEVVSPYYDPRRVIQMVIRISSEADGLKLLANAFRLTFLTISITWSENLLKLKDLLQAISRLTLETFNLEETGHCVGYEWTKDDLYALQQVFQIPSLKNCTMNINNGWTHGIRDVFQSYLNSDRNKIMQIRLTTKDGKWVIQSTSSWNYLIKIAHPEQFPFASFISKYETKEIMNLTFCNVRDISKKAIVATCEAFAEQNRNRSFNLLFVIKDFASCTFYYQSYRDIDDELYKFNLDSK